jgi:hypothetical protein
MTPDVIRVKTLPDYCLQAEFADGQIRDFDMKPYLAYPAFSALKEHELFSKAKVQYGTVVWNDEIDLSPDTLYLANLAKPPSIEPSRVCHAHAEP